MNRTCDLSICIVNWNGREMLRNLLRSIEQNRGSLEPQTIVVDNGSVDGSAEMVAREFPDVVLLHNPRNLGFARANNEAVARATGRHVLFLNNDTVVRPGGLQTLLCFLDEHPEVSAVGPKLTGADGCPQRSGRSLPTVSALLQRIEFLRMIRIESYERYRNGDFDPLRSGPVGQLPAAALLVRREQLDACGRWDEGFAFGIEDVDLCKRLGAYGSIWYLAEAEIEHLGSVSSRDNRVFVYRGYECGYARYLRKHRGMLASTLYKALVTLDMPVRMVRLCSQSLWHALRRNHDKARRARQRLIAAGAFLLRDLPGLWFA